MNNIYTRSILFVFFLLFVSCSNTSGPEDTIPSENNTNFDVTWTDNTKFFDSTSKNSLIQNDTSNMTLYFDPTKPMAKELKTGDIIMVHGEVLAKALDVSEVAGKIKVKYENAKLTDAIKDGILDWSVTTDFDRAAVFEMIIPNGKGGEIAILEPTSLNTIDYTGKVGPYKYKITLDITKDNLGVNLSIEKKINEYVSAKFSTKGKISKMKSISNIEIENSELKNFDYKNDNVEGELTVSMEAKADAGADDIGLNIPVVLVKYPFLVGPIPVILTIKLDFAMSYGVPLGAKAQAKVEASFSFNSNGNFNYNGTTVDYKASAGNLNINKKEGLTTAPSPIWAEYGVSFPYISLNILGNTVVPTFKSTFIVRGDYSPPVFTDPPCHNAYLYFAGVAGIDLNFFNVNLYQNDVNLWFKDYHFIKEGCD